ncbi:CBS domain protein [Stackebrandtia albiflava]|uniref:CBS domain protein n=1 Tax=Stackebrandtia albiflava TaxID=406432 RepID=A0A562ULH8_9ACTN|nr:CBS domain-containing protein [Stackebrandtia albiflava]TWJ06473.1 CBS domain protein [Stackebrandtia albiflava]
MRVTEAMTTDVLAVGPAHSLRQAARLMADRRVGAAVVVDPEAHGHGIITERDIMIAIGAGRDPDLELVAAHLTGDLVFADPEWTLRDAAAAMVRGGFRHLVVVDAGEVRGVLSVRDIVRVWSGTAAADVPGSAHPPGELAV